MSEMTLEEKVQRALDYQEIQNVMAAHSYYYEAQKQWDELDAIWSKRDDIAYGQQHIGRKAVIEYDGKTNELSRKVKLEMMSKLFPDIKNTKQNEGIGDMVIHLLTTPYIEIARDGKTAKGLWYGPSVCSEVGHDGEPVVVSIWEKCETDFIKEDGKWKIWHFRQWPEFAAQIDKSFVDGSKGFPRRTAFPSPKPAEEPKAGAPGPAMYSSRRVAKLEPKLPQPYESWDDSLSCIK